MTAPFIKWAGGKGKLVEEVIAKMPGVVQRYHEPFVGGGAIFFALSKLGRVKEAFLSDSNVELVNAYNVVKKDVDGLIRELTQFESLYKSRDNEQASLFYYRVRATDPKLLPDAERAARFIFLNRTCYNGLYRVNRKGEFNVPCGKYKNPTICNEEGLRAASVALQRAHIEARSYDKYGTAPYKLGDTVYFDPPYLPVAYASKKKGVAATSFTSYDAPFGLIEHEKLAMHFDLVSSIGTVALLSNSDTPDTRELYKSHTVTTVRAPRAINRQADARGDVNEILVIGRGAA